MSELHVGPACRVWLCSVFPPGHGPQTRLPPPPTQMKTTLMLLKMKTGSQQTSHVALRELGSPVKPVVILFQKEMKACRSQPAVGLRPVPPAAPWAVRQAGRPGAQGPRSCLQLFWGLRAWGRGFRLPSPTCHPRQGCPPAGEALISWKSILPGSSQLLWSPPPAPNSHRGPNGVCAPGQTPARGQRCRVA